MQLWICGQAHDEPAKWDFQGVFDTKEKAEAACREWNYFVAPATLNGEVPPGHIEWPGCYFPKAEQAQ